MATTEKSMSPGSIEVMQTVVASEEKWLKIGAWVECCLWVCEGFLANQTRLRFLSALVLTLLRLPPSSGTLAEFVDHSLALHEPC